MFTNKSYNKILLFFSHESVKLLISKNVKI